MRNITFLIILFIFPLSFIKAQKATIRVENMTMKTYLFSDPNPVAEPGRIYPYFRFDGYTNKSIQKEWKMVILENDYIKVFVCPDIGGKVWGAIEKSTGKEFLYYNHVVKFRDVAMRGPWTSGGLEYNFGDIGHIPTCATPVDYNIKENTDGSVSCTVGAIDLPSRTKWNMEIILHQDKAFFKTRTSWFNLTPVPNTYYHWMNAAAKASGNLHFIYPGDHYIGHGGKYGSWPIENNRDLSWYENNNFGPYKSYHVINSYTNFFGGYWQDDDFGFGHLASYDDKPGKKLWIWGLSRQGMIWEDLLTDNDGQYIEFQAGKLFNQAAYSSTFTPFKHKEFLPYDSDIMLETWFPLVQTGGMVAASEYAVMNVERKGNAVQVKISALQNLNDNLMVRSGIEIITSKRINLNPLQLDSLTFEIAGGIDFTIELGDSKLKYSSSLKERMVDRPIDPNKDFDWNSAYGLYIRGLEQEKQRMYNEAMESYDLCLEKEKSFAPAINRKALLLYKKMDYKTAKDLVLNSLNIDTYDPEANYVYGLACLKTGEITNAKSGFSIAAASVKYRTASYTKLAEIFLRENNFIEALDYTGKALSYNIFNVFAYEIRAIAYRKTNQKEAAYKSLDKLTNLDPTLHFSIFEKYLWDEATKKDFLASVYNELPAQTYLELAIFYYNLACDEEAMEVLKLAPETPLVSLWMAKLDQENRETHLNKALSSPIDMVFPYREESAAILEEFVQTNINWKLKYYLGLIYWNKGLLNAAQELFKDCSKAPDAVPFYLSKAKLFRDDPEVVFESLSKARELDKDDWRAALAIIKFDLANSRAEDVLQLAKEFAMRYPEKPALGLSYVEALIKTKQFKKSIEFIENYNILPFEGGTIGRDLYHDACIQEALYNMKKGKYKNTIKYAEKAREWPEKLGVGRPYDVDERMENYVIARALEKSGKKTKSGSFLKNSANYKRSAHANENSKLIFQLQAMKQLNKEQEAMTLLKKTLDEFPDNPYLKWVSSVFLQDDRQEKIKNKILGNQVETKPYDITFIDDEFELVTNIFSTLNK